MCGSTQELGQCTHLKANAFGLCICHLTEEAARRQLGQHCRQQLYDYHKHNQSNYSTLPCHLAAKETRATRCKQHSFPRC